LKTKYWGICDRRNVRRMVHHCYKLYNTVLLLMARYLVELLRGSKDRLTRADREEIADEIENLMLRLELEKTLRTALTQEDKKP
jgi:lipoate-protein ligase A